MMSSGVFERNLRVLTNVLRSYSSKQLVDVKVNDKTGVAVVSMQRPPVNGLNLELLTELSETLDGLASNKTRGMILTSTSNSVFCAGLDLKEVHKPKPERFRNFWGALQDVCLKLYMSSYPTVAAINGHSPAAGCLLSLCCEYRVMVSNFTIGLNETQLAIVAPYWIMAFMKNVIGTRAAELALTSGKLFTTDEALKTGLVDEIASDKADAVVKAENFITRFANINPLARQLTKTSVRGVDVAYLMDNREEDTEKRLSYVSQPFVQEVIDSYIQALKGKSK